MNSLPLLLDRLGLTFQFLSFWFVAPEFLGENRMKVAGKMLADFLSTSIFLTVTIAVLALAWVLAFREGLHWFHQLSLALAFSSLILIPKFLFYRRVKKVWVPKLIHHLTSDRHFRRGFLLIGGVLFTLGFVLQILGTF